MSHTLFSRLVLLLPLFVLGASSLHGVVIINVNQVGADVAIEGTGSINLASTTGTSTGSANHAFNADISGSIFVGVFPDPSDAYAIANLATSGPQPTSNPVVGPIGGDPTKGIFVNSLSGGKLFVPLGYISNSPLDFTASITSYDFRDYGFADGDSLVLTWSNGAVAESLTMNFNVVPEPAATAFAIGLGALGVAALRRRMKS